MKRWNIPNAFPGGTKNALAVQEFGLLLESVLVQLHGSLAHVNYSTKAFLCSCGLGNVRSTASLCVARMYSIVDIGLLRAAFFFQRLLHQVELDFEGGYVVWRRRGINA